MSNSDHPGLTRLNRGHRYETFDCLEEFSNEWLVEPAWLLERVGVQTWVLHGTPIVQAFFAVDPRPKDAEARAGWLEVPVLAVDKELHGKKYGRALLDALHRLGRRPDVFGPHLVGLKVAPRTKWCRDMLIEHKFQPNQFDGYYRLKIA